MSRMIVCKKLNTEAEGLSTPPFPGELGRQIYEHVSKQAWKMWLDHQTMLINEYRLSLLDPKAREFLQEEMKKFFFEGGADKPAGFSPQDKT